MVITALAGLTLMAVLVVLSTAGTVWLVKVRPAVEHDPDTQFWYLFAGLCILLPAVLITAVLNRWAGAALAVLAAGTWWWTNRVVARRMRLLADADARQMDDAERRALSARHNSVLARWRRYELDPAEAIDFPAMSDVRVPETSAMVKAMALAELLRRSTGPGGTAEYRAAVAVLESAFRTAEDAAAQAAAGSS